MAKRFKKLSVAFDWDFTQIDKKIILEKDLEQAKKEAKKKNRKVIKMIKERWAESLFIVDFETKKL